MKYLLFAAITFVSSVASSHATTQASDEMTYNRERGFINENPISEILSKRQLKFEMISTANYAGYSAGWKIADNKLLLSKFMGRKDGEDKDLKWLFPDSKGEVFAKWFSGNIHLFLGDVKLRKIHGHVVVTEKIVVFEVKEGLVQKTTVLKYPENIDVVNKMTSEFLGEEIDIRKVDY
jgi:hypothetical protein